MIEARAPLLIDKIPPTMTRRNKERRGVTCDLDCSQILQLKVRIAFLFTENRTVWTWPIKPSRDPVTYLVKYYPVLQKTAKGNLTSKKETFFFRHFVPLFTAHCTALTTSLSDVYLGILPLDGNSGYTLRRHDRSWPVSIINFFLWFFWQEFVSDGMLFNLFFGSGWRTRTFIWWICSGKNRSASLFLSPRMCVCWMLEINEL